MIYLILFLYLLNSFKSSISDSRLSSMFGDNDESSSVKIDINNPNDLRYLDQFNITKEEIEMKRHAMEHADIYQKSSTTPAVPINDRFYQVKLLRHERVKNEILSTRNNQNQNESDTASKATIVYPLCTSNNNENSWVHDYNQTIRFGDTVLNFKINDNIIKYAILQLYKLPANQQHITTTTASAAADSSILICDNLFYYKQIRLTISIIQIQSKRNKNSRSEATERKKIICSTQMVPLSYVGWIEIDVKRAIYLWKSTNQHVNTNYRVIIEVHDEEDKPLIPGQYFQPPKCLTRTNNDNSNYMPNDESAGQMNIKVGYNKC